MTALVIACVVVLAGAALYFWIIASDADTHVRLERGISRQWRERFVEEAQACEYAESTARAAMRMGLAECERLRHKVACEKTRADACLATMHDLADQLVDVRAKLADAIEGERVAREGREIAAAQAMTNAADAKAKGEAIGTLYIAAGTAEDKIRELTARVAMLDRANAMADEVSNALRAKIERLTKGRVKRPAKRRPKAA